MRTLLALCLLIFSMRLTASTIILENPNANSQQGGITIETKGWEETNWNVVAKSFQILVEHYNDLIEPSLDFNIVVKNGTLFNLKGPRTQFLNDSTTVIYLTSTKNYWAQFLYQFSHEYLHCILHRDFSISDKFGWLEESLCELSSLYALTLASKYPYNLKTQEGNPLNHFSSGYKSYVSDFIERQPIKIKPEQMVNYIRENIESLSNDRYLREINAVLAIRFLPLFAEDNTYWKVVKYIPKHIGQQNETLLDFTDKWIENTPLNMKDKLNRILTTFIEN